MTKITLFLFGFLLSLSAFAAPVEIPNNNTKTSVAEFKNNGILIEHAYLHIDSNREAIIAQILIPSYAYEKEIWVYNPFFSARSTKVSWAGSVQEFNGEGQNALYFGRNTQFERILLKIPMSGLYVNGKLRQHKLDIYINMAGKQVSATSLSLQLN